MIEESDIKSSDISDVVGLDRTTCYRRVEKLQAKLFKRLT